MCWVAAELSDTFFDKFPDKGMLPQGGQLRDLVRQAYGEMRDGVVVVTDKIVAVGRKPVS
jgi:hypothetical protein